MDASCLSTTYTILSDLDLGDVLSALVIELCQLSNMPTIFEEKLALFGEEMKKSKGHRGVENGWKIERDNGREFASLVGYDSVEAHAQVTAVAVGHIAEEWGKVTEYAGDIDLHHATLTKDLK
jgi:hypothetical protein